MGSVDQCARGLVHNGVQLWVGQVTRFEISKIGCSIKTMTLQKTRG